MEYPTTIEHKIICYLNVEPVMLVWKREKSLGSECLLKWKFN